MSFQFLYVTTDSPEEARKIGRALIEERFAACVNILNEMSSLYWWEGKVTEGEEAVLIVKTREDLVPTVTDRIKALHSYTVPCVVALPITQGNPDFLAWIERETKSS
jgi:periplasmic divalent cation tolerance protein